MFGSDVQTWTLVSSLLDVDARSGADPTEGQGELTLLLGHFNLALFFEFACNFLAHSSVPVDSVKPLHGPAGRHAMVRHYSKEHMAYIIIRHLDVSTAFCTYNNNTNILSMLFHA